LSGAEIPQGTAIFNLTRQLGGSIGIAFLATELTRRGSEHRADLVSMVGSYDPTTVQRLTALTRNLIAKGYDPYTAKQTAYQILDLTVQRQAIMLAFRDIFYIVGILMLLAIPLIFVLRKPGAGALHMGE
jgi:DHA2 family multidrug resistance protein